MLRKKKKKKSFEIIQLLKKGGYEFEISFSQISRKYVIHTLNDEIFTTDGMNCARSLLKQSFSLKERKTAKITFEGHDCTHWLKLAFSEGSLGLSLNSSYTDFINIIVSNSPYEKEQIINQFNRYTRNFFSYEPTTLFTLLKHQFFVHGVRFCSKEESDLAKEILDKHL